MIKWSTQTVCINIKKCMAKDFLVTPKLLIQICKIIKKNFPNCFLSTDNFSLKGKIIVSFCYSERRRLLVVKLLKRARNATRSSIYIYETDMDSDHSVKLDSDNGEIEEPEQVPKVKKGKWKIDQETDVKEPARKQHRKMWIAVTKVTKKVMIIQKVIQKILQKH